MTPAEYRDALAQLQWSQAAAARLLGVNARTSRRWACGERDIPPPAIRFLQYLIATGKSGEKALIVYPRLVAELNRMTEAASRSPPGSAARDLVPHQRPRATKSLKLPGRLSSSGEISRPDGLAPAKPGRVLQRGRGRCRPRLFGTLRLSMS